MASTAGYIILGFFLILLIVVITIEISDKQKKNRGRLFEKDES